VSLLLAKLLSRYTVPKVVSSPLPFLVVTLVPAVVAWWIIFLGGQLMGAGSFTAKAIASGLAFILWPLLMLRLTHRRLELGGLDINFVWGLALYGVITLVLLAFYPHDPVFFEDLVGSPRWLYLLKVVPVVMAVDLLTKRFVQKELARMLGDTMAEVAQALVWFFGHALELIWLKPLLGTWGSILFIATTGLATGRLYRHTGNVTGMMVGHWMVSLVVVIVVDSGL